MDLFKKFVAIIFATVFFSSCLNADMFPEGKVFIVIPKDLYPYLNETVFQDWIGQLEKEGWETNILKPEPYRIRHPDRLKDYLTEQKVYADETLFKQKTNGVILLGHFPETRAYTSPGPDFLESDLWYMDASDKASLIDRHNRIAVKPNEIFEPLNVWVSRIEDSRIGNDDKLLHKSATFINQYLKKNVECRSSGFNDDDCLFDAKVSGKQLWESKALIGVSGSDKDFAAKIVFSNGVAGENFLNAFEQAQKNGKQWQDYVFEEGWEHCYSFLGDMYRAYNQNHIFSTGGGGPIGSPPVDKLVLYILKVPPLLLSASASAFVSWKYPSLRLPISAIWAVATATSMAPVYQCLDDYRLPKRHYLPVLLGDGTLRKF